MSEDTETAEDLMIKQILHAVEKTRNDIGEIRQSQSDIQNSQTQVKADMLHVKMDISELKNDVKPIVVELPLLKHRIRTVETEQKDKTENDRKEASESRNRIIKIVVATIGFLGVIISGIFGIIKVLIPAIT